MEITALGKSSRQFHLSVGGEVERAAACRCNTLHFAPQSSCAKGVRPFGNPRNKTGILPILRGNIPGFAVVDPFRGLYIDPCKPTPNAINYLNSCYAKSGAGQKRLYFDK